MNHTSTHPLNKNNCENCKTLEKQYFVSEGKYMKAVDKINVLKKELIANDEELKYLTDNASLLPSTTEDLNMVK